jgi:hypothetical protein
MRKGKWKWKKDRNRKRGGENSNMSARRRFDRVASHAICVCRSEEDTQEVRGSFLLACVTCIHPTTTYYMWLCSCTSTGLIKLLVGLVQIQHPSVAAAEMLLHAWDLHQARLLSVNSLPAFDLFSSWQNKPTKQGNTSIYTTPWECMLLIKLSNQTLHSSVTSLSSLSVCIYIRSLYLLVTRLKRRRCIACTWIVPIRSFHIYAALGQPELIIHIYRPFCNQIN